MTLFPEPEETTAETTAEEERQQEQSQQDQAVEQEQTVEQTVQAVEEAVQASEMPDPGRFEEWLETQKGRTDGVGRLARWVLEDIERGCWRETFTAPGYEDLYYGNAWVARSKKYCIEHLIVHHGVDNRSIEIFEEAWQEYLAARWKFVTRNFHVQPAEIKHPADFA